MFLNPSKLGLSREVPSLKDFMLKQPMMRRVIIALLPILAFSILNFGWKVLINTLVSTGVCFFIEYVFERMKKKKISEAVFVTGLLVGLILPPSTPLWIVAVASGIGIFFGKEVFGGFGRNVFNPAMVGRAFVYVSFPLYLTAKWNLPVFPNGFKYWLSPELTTGATPLEVLKSGELLKRLDLFFGNISGSSGETAKWLIVAAAFYLILTKTASWKIILSTVGSMMGLTLILQLPGIVNYNVFDAVLSGGVLFAAVFMATDPISAPRKEAAKWLYGLIIGVSATIIRTFSLFSEGIMFGVLIGNTFAPLLDVMVSSRSGKK
ncbi:MAG: Na+-transporting NADH:ubiquinone oxidoreductase subunit [Thermotogota bacterium]|nr:Na+-transporting NADH:ubiquinone oxidoreductase subunit [Thermotogota bacterium]MDK2863975.1 Na+-transporting NADH:ubiquinone oxidoreductase subunit [Thermotogota bacterium]HCZ06361.1 NQR2 and RnfD family protein [Thermotogota bacterium]